MGVLLVLYTIAGFIIVASAIDVVFKNGKIDNSIFYFSIVMAILTPILVFAIIVPNIIVQGPREEYSTIISSTGKTYHTMVEYNIEKIESYSYDDEVEYSIGYYPKKILWSNGGIIWNSFDEYGEIGDKVSFMDSSSSNEYYVIIPNFSFSLKEQFNELSFVDKIAYVLIFSSSIILIYKKISNTKNHTYI